MALLMYMTVTGKTQGEIKGDSEQEGSKKDKITVYSHQHRIEIPTDTHTGKPTGQRIHHPFEAVIKKSQASPKLCKALCTGEQVSTVLDFYRIKEGGEEELYYQVTLDEATIVEYTANTPLTFVEQNKPYHDMETMKFTYSKITWKYSDGNIEYTDNWHQPSK